jgi:broad specificity phosphatase PhoE
MGKPPAYLFVVRHGTRLDAADKQWHLSSPTPYDPPLTYGGWLQSRALGARIGGILRDDSAANGPDPGADKAGQAGERKHKRRKLKVVIHSSPFLRCIQTSIGISAGMASVLPAKEARPASSKSLEGHPPRSVPQPDASGPGRPAASNSDTPSSTSDSKTSSITASDVHKPAPGHIQTRFELHTPAKPSRALLRVDAFLSEWMTPSYFETITPPPGSVMMVASAKAALLKKEDYSAYPGFGGAHVHSSSHGQLDVNSSYSPLRTPTSNLPPQQLAPTSAPSAVPSQAVSSIAGGYVAPIPSYSISSSATIPMGYVSHAKDATVDVDYQWDSMRGPYEWGDGGSFGEEWTSMHKRFKWGLQKMIDWYAAAEHPADKVGRPRVSSNGSSDSAAAVGNGDDDDAEEESVVIIVSHGAGCNALIGAITHQPVLTDVGMCSVTMAVRKPREDNESHETPQTVAASPQNGFIAGPGGHVTIHECYDLKLFADTDHLRSSPIATRSPLIAALQSRGRPSSSILTAHNHYTGYYDPAGSRSSSANAVMGLNKVTGRRDSNNAPPPRSPYFVGSPRGQGGITVGSGVTSFERVARSPSGLSRTPSMGLWSPGPRFEEQSAVDDEDEDEPPAKDGFNQSVDRNHGYESNVNRRAVSGASLPSPAISPVSLTAINPRSASRLSSIPDLTLRDAASDSTSLRPSSALTTASPKFPTMEAIPIKVEERSPERLKRLDQAFEAHLERHYDQSKDAAVTKGAGPGGLWGGSSSSPRTSTESLDGTSADRAGQLLSPATAKLGGTGDTTTSPREFARGRDALKELRDVREGGGMKRRWTVNERI